MNPLSSRLLALAGRLDPRSRGEGPLARAVLPGARTLPDDATVETVPDGILDDLVRRARRARRPYGYGEEYDLIRDAFDPAFYFSCYPDIFRAGLDPVAHYIRAGAREGRDPSPDFSTRTYRNLYPGLEAAGLTPLGHWLRFGSTGQVATNLRTGRPILPRIFLPHPDILPPPDGPPGHYGQRLDELVRLSRAAPAPPEYGEEYELIRDAFDPAFYFARYPDIIRAGVDPVAHYIRAGAREGRDPTPIFSTRAYVQQNPEAAMQALTPFGQWVAAAADPGSAALASRLENVVQMARVLEASEATVQALWIDRHKDVRARLDHGTMGEMVTRAAALDPQVALTWPKALELRIAGFNSDLVMARTHAMHQLAVRAGGRRARAVIVVNRPRWGGGRRMEGYIAHALAEIHGADEVLVITTEQGGEMPPGKLPAGVRHVDMSDLSIPTPETRQQVLATFLRSLRPETVFNVNSRLMWDVMGPYGHVLSQEMAVVGCLFCAEGTLLGHWTGYPIWKVYRHFDQLTALCTDSHTLARDLADRYLIPPDQAEKLRVLEAPVDPEIRQVEAPAPSPARRPQIFWSGRFDRQKRVDLVHAIAAAMPEADFRVWGEPVTVGNAIPLGPEPDNLFHEGVYAHFADLPMGDADLWLYTAGWDGVPSILLEVAMTGVPLVGTQVGGTGEILQEGLSWPIPVDAAEPDAYVAAIRAVLADPDAARARARSLRETLVAQRTPDAYRNAVGAIADLPPPVPRAVAPATPAAPAAPAATPEDAATDIDLSLLLTVHSETLVAGPTLRSAEAALARVEAAGFRVERLAGLDTASEASRRYMDQPALSAWTRHDYDFRDQGRTRNALAHAARGKWLAVLDADDMFSENWLEAALSRLSEPDADRTIVHSELMWQFDGSTTVYTNPAQDDPLFSPWYLAMQNYYDALCVGPRAAWIEHPYPARDVAGGYAYEDWQWGVETMAAGWHHEIARDTVIFKRRRDMSQSHESRTRRTCIRAIEPLAIDRIARLGSVADRRTRRGEA